MSNLYYTPRTGIGNVGSYQASAIPWVSSSVAPAYSTDPSSALKIEFPYVTKFIVVKNINETAGTLRVGFSANGVVSDNYFVLSKGESFDGELRVTELYLISNTGSPISASIVVGMTGIDSSNLPNSWSGSAGVG